MLSVPLGKMVALPLTVLTWIISVACLGITGSLLSKYGTDEGPEGLFPAGQSSSILILLTIASCFNTVFILIVILGQFVMTGIVGLGWTFCLLFLGFLQFVVGASAVSRDVVSCVDRLSGGCMMIKALEGLAWTETVLLMLTAGVVAWMYTTKAPAPREKHADML